MAWSLLVCGPLMSVQALGRKITRDVVEKRQEEADDFHDFFAVDDSEAREVKRTKKEPRSRAQVVMIQLGIRIALAMETAYNKVKACWLWLLSWIGYGSK